MCGTILVGLVLLAAVIAVIRSLIRGRRRGGRVAAPALPAGSHAAT